MSLAADETSDPPPDFALTAKYAADLHVRIQRVAKRAVRTVRFRAFLLVGVTLLIALLMAAAWDVWWRSSHPWMRWLLFALIAGAAGAAVVYWLFPALALRLSVLDAARKIERFFPEFGDRLSSVVALNEPPGARWSERSESLVRRSTIEAFERTSAYNLADALQPHRNRRLAMLAIATAALFTLFVLFLPNHATLALKRVTMPWLEAPWPRQHVLEIEALPRRIHAGSDLVVTVRDRQGNLPEDLAVWFRSDSGAEPLRLPLASSPDEANRTGEAKVTAVVRGDQVQDRFAIRAVGGDDRTMAWQYVDVLSPPRVQSALFRVTPPDYTALSTFETDDREFSVPAGSHVQFEAAVDRPLDTVAWSARSTVRPVRSEPTDEPTDASGDIATAQRDEMMPAEATLHLDSDGKTLQAAWTVPASLRSQILSIDWADRNGVSGRSAKRWKLSVVLDQPPQVVWRELPSSARFSADAVVPLTWRSTDDFGIAESWVEVTIVERSTVDDRSESVEPESHFQETTESTADRPASRKLQRVESLALSSLESISTGAMVRVVGVATDVQGQRGTTEPFLFQVVGDDELQTRMVEAGKKVLEQVREAKTQQQLALERTEETRGRLDDDEESRQAAADLLRIAEAAQEATLRRLDGGPQAAVDAATALLQEADINRLDNSIVTAIAEAVTQLKTTRDQAVLPANASLQNAADRLRGEQSDRGAVDPLLQDAIADQQRSADALQEVVEALSSSLQVQSVAQSIRDLADAQRRLAGATVRSEEASRPESERARLSASQQSLARETDQLQSDLDQLARSEEQSAERRRMFGEASEQLTQQRAPQRMREAAERLREQQVADAIAQQREISEDLTNVARQLQQGESSGGDAGDAVGWLREAMRIADRQALVADAIAEVVRLGGVGSDAAVRDQQDHARRTEQFAGTIDPLPVFGEVVRSAHRDMLAAAARLERDATDPRAPADAEAAAQRLREIAGALQAAAVHEAPPEPAAGEEEAPQNGEASEQSPVPLETIFLIRSVQARLQAQTKQLETLQQGELAPQDRRELEQQRRNIAREQSRLMEQLNELVKEGQLENE